MPVRKQISFNQDFWWSIDTEFLMSTKINICVKIVETQIKNGYLFAQTSILMGDVFTNKPVRIWLTLIGPSQVIENPP